MHEDTALQRKDGHLIDVAVSVAPMYDEGRNLVGISTIISDIGERRARVRHIEFLMREGSHRSKNLLAVVQAIAGQTALHGESLAELQPRFPERIAAMARSQDLPIGSNWTGTSVADLVHTQLAPFAETAFSGMTSTGRAWNSNPTPCTASRWHCTSLPPMPPNTVRYRYPMAVSPSAGK